MPLLEAGCDVLLEKPMAASREQCERLAEAAAASGAALGINQNFLFHPAFLALRRAVANGRRGRLRFVDCVYNVPLRQLSAGQLGHWMFAAPANILLEQAVHPLSQIAALLGGIEAVEAVPDAPHGAHEGRHFQAGWTISLRGPGRPATLRFAVGEKFPLWQLTAICDDGAIVADILGKRVHMLGRTRFADPIDGMVAPTLSAAEMVAGGIANAGRYGASLLGLSNRNDPFFRSMQGSIAAFHAAPARFESDAAFGARLVGLCEEIAARLPAERNRPVSPQAPATLSGHPDVAVLGGTGFIGRATVARLLQEGLSVAVMARGTEGLPPLFSGPRIRLLRGDIADAGAVAQAVAGAGAVVNLAHGGGGANYAAIRAAMVGGAEIVARACLAAGTARLLHVGSIASLYLGPGAGPVTGATPPDPEAARRGDYARAKAECDLMLLDLHARESLPVVILRPGLVVGPGTSPIPQRPRLLQFRAACHRLESWPQPAAFRAGRRCGRSHPWRAAGGAGDRALLQSGRGRAPDGARIPRLAGRGDQPPAALPSQISRDAAGRGRHEMAAEAGRRAAFAAALAAGPALARLARALRLQRRQARPRLGAAGRSGPLSRSRLRDGT